MLKFGPNNPALYPEGHNEEAEKGSSSPEGEKNPGKEESDAEDTSDMADLQREKGVLARLRGCPHIIQSGEFPADPLKPQVPKRAYELTEWLNLDLTVSATRTVTVLALMEWLKRFDAGSKQATARSTLPRKDRATLAEIGAENRGAGRVSGMEENKGKEAGDEEDDDNDDKF
ncbi:hypothetical protein LQW54_009641 [Pestalotiopsis sp. IQ-011]